MCMSRNVIHAQCMGIYLTIQYKGECGHIEGHAYSVLFVHNETCVFLALGFLVHMSLILNSLMHSRKHHFIIQ